MDRKDGKVFYLPHHPVINVNKDKIRIVFDCSAKHKGTSLNDQVLQGPDLTNKLTSVLLRFREDKVAVIGDVEAMYHQVRVPTKDRDMLRFLWFEENDTGGRLKEYRMTVHLFGGIWSSSAANYALRRTADDHGNNEGVHSSEAAESILMNFYVDDWLASFPSREKAIKLIGNITDLLSQGRFKLTKFISIDKKVLKSIPPDRRAKGLIDVDLDIDLEMPHERALGIKWNTNKDTFYFKVKPVSKPNTRRGIISIISSIYDPLGFISPVVIVGKMMFQELTKRKLGWDDPMPGALEVKWKKWCEELPLLEEMQIPRCVKPITCHVPVQTQLHHFSDASQAAYGVVTFLRVVDSLGHIHVALLMSKARLAPIKAMTIPRLELTAAVLASKLDTSLKTSVKMKIDTSPEVHTSGVTVNW